MSVEYSHEKSSSILIEYVLFSQKTIFYRECNKSLLSLFLRVYFNRSNKVSVSMQRCRIRKSV